MQGIITMQASYASSRIYSLTISSTPIDHCSCTGTRTVVELFVGKTCTACAAFSTYVSQITPSVLDLRS